MRASRALCPRKGACNLDIRGRGLLARCLLSEARGRSPFISGRGGAHVGCVLLLGERVKSDFGISWNVPHLSFCSRQNERLTYDEDFPSFGSEACNGLSDLHSPSPVVCFLSKLQMLYNSSIEPSRIPILSWDWHHKLGWMFFR